MWDDLIAILIALPDLTSWPLVEEFVLARPSLLDPAADEVLASFAADFPDRAHQVNRLRDALALLRSGASLDDMQPVVHQVVEKDVELARLLHRIRTEEVDDTADAARHAAALARIDPAAAPTLWIPLALNRVEALHRTGNVALTVLAAREVLAAARLHGEDELVALAEAVLARVLLADPAPGTRAEARALLDAAIPRLAGNPELPRAQLLHGVLLLEDPDDDLVETARSELIAAMDALADSAQALDVLLDLGSALLRSAEHDPSAAYRLVSCGEAALRSSALPAVNRIGLWGDLAQQAFNHGPTRPLLRERTMAAFALIEPLLADAPDDLVEAIRRPRGALLLATGRALLDAGDPAGALNPLREAIGLGVPALTADAAFWLVAALERGGSTPEAYEAVEPELAHAYALADGPNRGMRAMTAYLLGLARLRAGRPADAVGPLREADAEPTLQEALPPEAASRLLAVALLETAETDAELAEAGMVAARAAELAAGKNVEAWAEARLNAAIAGLRRDLPKAREHALEVCADVLKHLPDGSPTAREAHQLRVQVLVTSWPTAGRAAAARAAITSLDALRDTPPGLDTEMRSGLLTARGWLAEAGDVESARWVIQHGEPIAAELRASGDQLGWLRALFSVAVAYRISSYGDRRQNLERGIALMEELDTALNADAPPDVDNADAVRAELAALTAELYRQRLAGDHTANLEYAVARLEPHTGEDLRLSDPAAWALVQQNRGVAYLHRVAGDRTANVAAAVAAYRAALTVVTVDSDPENWANLHLNLSHALIEAGEAGGARQAAEAALTVFSPTDHAAVRTLALCNLASALMLDPTSENTARAVGAAQEARQLVAGNDEPWKWADATAILAGALHHHGRATATDNVDEVLSTFRDALAFFTPARAPRRCQEIASDALIAASLAGRWTDAATFALVAVEALDAAYSAAATTAGQLAALKAAGALHTDAAVALVRAGRPLDAVLVVERGRARTLTDLVERRRTERRLAADYPAEQARLAAAREALAVAADSADPAALDAAAGTLEAALAVVRTLPGYERFLAGADGDDLRRALAAAPGTALVYSLVSETVLHLVVRAVPDDVAVEVVETAATADAVQHALARRDASGPAGLLAGAYFGGPALTAALEADLPAVGSDIITPLMPVLAEPRPTRIVLLPGGRLGVLPLHAAPAADGRCLLDVADVAYAPSARLLGEPAGPHGTPHHPLVVGDPTGDLPYAAREANLVSAALGTTPLPSAEATVDAVLARLAGASHVHVACHGRFDPVDPLRSAVVLADGELTVEQLLDRHPLDAARLVVASACQTALVDLRDLPDELLGLPAAFLRAGATTALGTLWPVPDYSTLLLMDRFYHGLPAAASPAAALCAAQRWLRDATTSALHPVLIRLGLPHHWLAFHDPDDRPLTHPRHWAAFVAFGS